MTKQLCKCKRGYVTHEYYYGNHERVCGSCASVIACDQAPKYLKSDPIRCLEKYFHVIDTDEFLEVKE